MFEDKKIRLAALGGVSVSFMAALVAPLIMSFAAAPKTHGPQLAALEAKQDAAPVKVRGVSTLPTSLTELVSQVASDLDVEAAEEEHCLAQAVYFEARSEALEGQLAVAQVVLNRALDRRYPENICGVVFQGEHRRNRCQFSFACDGQSDSPRNAQAWAIAKAVSHIALNDYWNDVTSLSTHYHADYVSPYWGDVLDEQVQVGRHIFYRDNSF